MLQAPITLIDARQTRQSMIGASQSVVTNSRRVAVLGKSRSNYANTLADLRIDISQQPAGEEPYFPDSVSKARISACWLPR